MMRAARSGLSLVEVLVVIGITAVLSSLILIAVQSSRESARRLKCQNNLHQTGIAVSNFVQSRGRFPSLLGNVGTPGRVDFYQPPFEAILPELEAVVPRKSKHYIPNDSPQNFPPDVLRCPSSNEFLAYRYCIGSGIGTIQNWDGVLRIHNGLRASEITDGLSNTALMSERMSGKEHRKPVALALLPTYLTDQRFVDDCKALINPTEFKSDVGLDWLEHQSCDVGYRHYAPPNWGHWDCKGGWREIVCARSYHSGGVFTLYADGSVHWASSNIDVVTWRAVGTVAGQEVLQLTF